MNLLVPAALAFSLIIPIILLFYFMRPKRQERVVGSTLLWQQALQDLQASRPWQRLRITPLLLLQLLAAAIIVLVLARPAIFTSSSISGDTIIILQASASMQATDVAPNRFENAKNQIADFIDTLGPSDHLSLITMARTPQVLIANSQEKGQLTTALQHAKVTNQGADLEQALALATSLAAGRANLQVLVLGDGHVQTPDQPLDVPFPVRYLSVGIDVPNAALLALAPRVVQGNLVALAQVANYSHQQRAIPVELYADSRLVSVQTITLPAEASGAVQWGPLPATSRFLHAKLITQDALTVDHDAWAIVGGSLHGRVLLVTKGNTFLETALRLQSNIDLYETTPDKYVTLNTYDLTIFDGFVPPTLPSGNLFFINPNAGTYPFGTVGQETRASHISVGNDTINLLNAVDLGSIHTIRYSHQLTPALWAQPIITAPETPLLIAGENNNTRVAVLGFDLHDSDLPLQPSFPILIFNMINWFLPAPVAGNGQVVAGLPVTVHAWPGTTQVTITSPDQQRVTIGPPVLPFDKTNQTGIYQVTQQIRGVTRTGAFTVNVFDPIQSKLAPTKTLPIANSTNFTTSTNPVPRELREIWPWIAAFLLLVLCTEWWLFSRGYKQQNPVPQTRGRYTESTLKLVPTSRFSALQAQLEERYRVTMKRFTKTVKRTRKRVTQQRQQTMFRGGTRDKL